jgi:hypothetical protein
MPYVELVQIEEPYYVRDGYDGISVAKYIDQEAIEARMVN